MAVEIWLSRCRLVGPPALGFFRVSSWHEPFAPPDPPPPLVDSETGEAAEAAGRWDDLDGGFRTLYCATVAEGAIGEKLGDFTLNPKAASKVEPPREFWRP
jgi:hypothetical protein